MDYSKDDARGKAYLYFFFALIIPGVVTLLSYIF